MVSNTISINDLTSEAHFYAHTRPSVHQVCINITTLYQTNEILIQKYSFLVKKKKEKKIITYIYYAFHN